MVQFKPRSVRGKACYGESNPTHTNVGRQIGSGGYTLPLTPRESIYSVFQVRYPHYI
jgi:hypothetical protein